MDAKRKVSPADSKRWSEHERLLFSCRACPTVVGTPVSGVVRHASVMLVGQAPGPREADAKKPFAYTAGRRLFEWFASIGVPEETFRANVYIGAAIRCFPGRAPQGGDRVPSPEEIVRCSAHLDRELLLLRPSLLISVGTLSAKMLLGRSELSKIVGVRHRASRVGVDFDVIVLPHPSGRSTWLNRPEHRAMLEASLDLIREHDSFAEASGR